MEMSTNTIHTNTSLCYPVRCAANLNFQIWIFLFVFVVDWLLFILILIDALSRL